MNKNILLAVLVSGVMVCASVYAEAPKGAGPESISFKTLKMPFPHWKHQVYNGSECFQCHKTDGEKIAGWGQEAAHTLCVSCHDLNDKGPVSCKQCHI